MTDANEFLKRMNEQREWEATKRRFYGEFLPTIVGKVFAVGRSYGHARYEILPAHERGMNTTYTMFHYDERGNPVITGNQIYPRTLRVNFKRLGGWNGSAIESGYPLLEQILRGFMRGDN